MTNFEKRLNEAISRRLAPISICRESLELYRASAKRFGEELIELAKIHREVAPIVKEILTKLNGEIGANLREEYNYEDIHDRIENEYMKIIKSIKDSPAENSSKSHILRVLRRIHDDVINRMYVPLKMTASVHKPIEIGE
jgi:hypothetical protein